LPRRSPPRSTRRPLAALLGAGFAIARPAEFALVPVIGRRPPAGAPTAGPAGSGERARDGVVLLFRHRTLGVVLASLLFMSASIAAEVVFLRDDLEVTGAAYGVLFSSWTVGMVFGALVVSPRVRAGSLAGAALVAVGVQGAGLGLPTVWLAAGFGAAMYRLPRSSRRRRADGRLA
jgi:hypothetical protein